MTTNYQRGATFERKVKADMEKHGYIAVRSPASKSPVDVYCWRHGQLVCIQCKTDGRLAPDEWNEFFEYCEPVWAVPIMAMKGARGTPIVYKRLLGRKEKRGKQPMEDWQPEGREQ